MKRTFAVLSVASVTLATLLPCRDAHALGPVDLEAGAKVGLATNPSSGGGAPNPLGFGVGGRAGLAFLGGVYAGGSIMYYLGSSTSPPSGSQVPSVSFNTLMYGGELGYGIRLLNLVTIRPQVGLGNAAFAASSGGTSSSSNYWYLEPGVTGLVGLGLLYVGADANALVFPSLPSGQVALSLHAQIGVQF